MSRMLLVHQVGARALQVYARHSGYHADHDRRRVHTQLLTLLQLLTLCCLQMELDVDGLAVDDSMVLRERNGDQASDLRSRLREAYSSAPPTGHRRNFNDETERFAVENVRPTGRPPWNSDFGPDRLDVGSVPASRKAVILPPSLQRSRARMQRIVTVKDTRQGPGFYAGTIAFNERIKSPARPKLKVVPSAGARRNKSPLKKTGKLETRPMHPPRCLASRRTKEERLPPRERLQTTGGNEGALEFAQNVTDAVTDAQLKMADILQPMLADAQRVAAHHAAICRQVEESIAPSLSEKSVDKVAPSLDPQPARAADDQSRDKHVDAARRIEVDAQCLQVAPDLESILQTLERMEMETDLIRQRWAEIQYHDQNTYHIEGQVTCSPAPLEIHTTSHRASKEPLPKSDSTGAAREDGRSHSQRAAAVVQPASIVFTKPHREESRRVSLGQADRQSSTDTETGTETQRERERERDRETEGARQFPIRLVVPIDEVTRLEADRSAFQQHMQWLASGYGVSPCQLLTAVDQVIAEGIDAVLTDGAANLERILGDC
ncbi:PREDICTED: uncharacterized protein LOC106807850 isoform X4 [Priapulus caudatus]|uniref:Uncharacterized protein LOC106807850 isoform X4 n=1 Tax=Priapulus caudatus TaxID=37621 RepID=A0ABM1E0U4_PRICU|nr:PREDICTED: uncharacterized protein LOC106807850 isoform X4 [Priapulus caudatus]